MSSEWLLHVEGINNDLTKWKKESRDASEHYLLDFQERCTFERVLLVTLVQRNS